VLRPSVHQFIGSGHTREDHPVFGKASTASRKKLRSTAITSVSTTLQWKSTSKPCEDHVICTMIWKLCSTAECWVKC